MLELGPPDSPDLSIWNAGIGEDGTQVLVPLRKILAGLGELELPNERYQRVDAFELCT